MATAAPTPLTTQEAMTLAAIAPTGASPRPSGETLAEQRDRISSGVGTLLADAEFLKAGGWQLMWLALSPGNANMAYLARSARNQIAVVIRGTAGNLTDVFEDFEVGTVVPFAPGAGDANPCAVSKGAMEAFTQAVNMRDRADGETLLECLVRLIGPQPIEPAPAVYVIGHSLGGCVATMVGVYLQEQAKTWQAPVPAFGLFAFAAPTAGLASFAERFRAHTWAPAAFHNNAFDLIPLAWTDLERADGWYKDGPVATTEVKELIYALEKLPGDNVYARPGAISEGNKDYKLHDGKLIHSTTEDFLGQVAFQHANDVYLLMLDAAPLPSGPVVESVFVDPVTARATITGRGLSRCTPKDTWVDFGPVPAHRPTIVSDTEITVDAPAGAGLVHVTVTNLYGTSAATPGAQYTFGGPDPILVAGVSPDTGAAGSTVTVVGWGFRGRPVVRFGTKVAQIVAMHLPGQLTVVVPERDPLGATTVDVTVTVGEITTPTSPADEFTYPRTL